MRQGPLLTGKVQGLEGQPAGNKDPQDLLVSPNPLPSPQYFLLRIQDNGQGRVGSSCMHSINPPGLHAGRPRIPVSLRGWGALHTRRGVLEKEAKGKGNRLVLNPTWGSAMASTGESASLQPRNVGDPGAHTLGGESEQPTPTDSRVRT